MIDVQRVAREELERQAEAIQLAADRLGPEMMEAAQLILESTGKVVVTGMGKTGIIARKISATLSSTGTTAIFLHAAEGIHGDLGMLAAGDVVIAVSHSGNTQELVAIVPYIHFLKVPIIAFTGNAESRLAAGASVVIDTSVPVGSETFGLVPTSSTTVALALGDALAVALLQARDFRAEDFAQFHPGGTIGRKLLLRVADLMHAGGELPCVARHTRLDAAIVEMTGKGLGCTAVVDDAGVLLGIITDGDLRRLLAGGDKLLSKSASECMTANPRHMQPQALAVDALTLMEDSKITMLPVVDDNGVLRGMLHMHDLIRAGVVG
ncbi:MAG: KpsF/GutQ family sugar-phosphate isomerase [Candidatus Cloacimonetes bacterium]|nr:KpsF/GutQ family sugar-phosphate isomerase [Candidatus Cloacimonadota bacterium]